MRNKFFLQQNHFSQLGFTHVTRNFPPFGEELQSSLLWV